MGFALLIQIELIHDWNIILRTDDLCGFDPIYIGIQVKINNNDIWFDSFYLRQKLFLSGT